MWADERKDMGSFPLSSLSPRWLLSSGSLDGVFQFGAERHRDKERQNEKEGRGVPATDTCLFQEPLPQTSSCLIGQNQDTWPRLAAQGAWKFKGKVMIMAWAHHDLCSETGHPAAQIKPGPHQRERRGTLL